MGNILDLQKWNIHKKQSGGAGQFAKVKLGVEPLEAGKGK